jgi:hypothetical protein
MDWLLLIHQIPAKPTYFRAKIWRRLQQIGAVPVKQAAYAMPRNEQAYEDLTWIANEIIQGGGEAILLEARFCEGLDDAQVISLFCEARKRDYDRVATELAQLQTLWRLGESGLSSSFFEYKTVLAKLRKGLASIAAIDFFSAPERDQVEAALADMETILQQKRIMPAAQSGSEGKRQEMTGKTWVTRANLYVDRMASAWLIQRYIDPHAAFKFVRTSTYAPGKDEIRFDMPAAEYTHEGDLCTFEVLARRFGEGAPELQQIAGIIHDIDLKDDAFNLPESDGIHALFDGIVAGTDDDLTRIQQTGIVLDGLLAFFKGKKSRASLTDQ